MPYIHKGFDKRAKLRLIMAAALLVCTAESQPSDDGWTITTSTAALTGAATTSALLQSSVPLSNMIGAPERAGLVLRCSEGALAAYVSWPQVLMFDTTGWGGGLQTMVLWRVDNGAIAVNFWDRADSGTAAGKFTTGGALKIIAKLATAKKLVVRMTGQTTQDAVFDLAGIADAIAQVEHTCGMTPTGRR